MIAPLDVFWFDEAGSPIWCASCPSLYEAKTHIIAQAASKHGKYLVYCAATGNKIFIEVDQNKQLIESSKVHGRVRPADAL